MLRKLLNRYSEIPIGAKAAFWFVICSFIQKAIAILTTPIFTRMMSTEQYGQFTVYRSWLSILAILTTLRLDYSVFNKGMSKFKEQRDEYVSTMQYITSALTLVMFLIYLVMHRQVNAVVEMPMFIMLAIFAELLVVPAISFWSLKKRYEYVYIIVIVCTLAMAVLNAGLGVIAVFLTEEKGYARVLSVVFVNLFFGIPIYFYNFKKGHYRFNNQHAKFALLFNLPLLAHFLSIYVLGQFDRIMIQKMVSFEAAALYGLTYQVGSLLSIFSVSLRSAMIPWMYGKLEAGDYSPVGNMVFTASTMVGMIVIVLSAIAPEAIALFAGDKYTAAIYVVPPVAIGLYFEFIYTLYANIEFFFELNKAAMMISISAACLNIVLNYICIKQFGYVAASYTTLLCYLLMCVGHYQYMIIGVKRKIGLKLEFMPKRMILISLATVSLGLISLMLYSSPNLRYLLIFFILVLWWNKRDSILQIYRMKKTLG